MKYIILSIIAVFTLHFGALAQPKLSFDLKKPKKFQDKKLASERTGEKKFGVPRRFVQNTVTHYNYYFNAKTKLEEVIARSKASFKDDYTKLLPFYNYGGETSASYKEDLDSVIIKATSGILLHDLRTNWVDNLYLLIGEAYYLRNDLDSAYLTFQYVNYTFSPKEKDGWDKVIGSNSNEGGNAFSISTKEKNDIVHKTLSRPPSRNESFIWQIRTYLAQDAIPEAAGLIQTLKNDPFFPSRLETDLQEMQALWFYKQKAYDSAALYLEKALPNAGTKDDQARWEYLIAQLYERAGMPENAKVFYARATKHTINPLLEVYAILNSLKQGGQGNEHDIQRAVEELVKMARKDKYYQYRDLVYYTAANIEQQRKHYDAANTLLQKSIKHSLGNEDQKSKSYLMLGDIAFVRQDFIAAQSYYDSVGASIIAAEDLAYFNSRKSALEKIAEQTKVIMRQDSLQRIAALPEAERTAFIKKLVKQLRKQQGLKEDRALGTVNFAVNDRSVSDLFQNNSKAEWYFSNASLKTKGQAEFISLWGERPNSDNWRRSASLSQQFAVDNSDNPTSTDKTAETEITYDALLAKIPLTPELQKISLDSTEHALFALGVAFQNGLEDYPSAIIAYEKLLKDFPATVHAEDAWFNLYYCYGKAGRPADQQLAKQTLAKSFSDGNLYAKINDRRAIVPDSLEKKQATIAYDEVYNLFIEGKFTDALSKKQAADSIYGKKYWNPQLLYIEAVYYIHQRDDSTAKEVLNNIVQSYPGTRMEEKSSNLIAALDRRKEIEDYLTNLQLDKPVDRPIVTREILVQQEIPLKDSTTNEPLTVEEVVQQMVSTIVKAEKDSIAAENKKVAVAAPIGAPKMQPRSVDTAQLKKAVTPVTPPAKQPVVTPSVPVVTASGYTNRPEQAHYVLFVMNKVDPVYVSEARNAFNRYNRENYYNTPIELTNLPLTDEVKMVVFDKFENSGKAIEYIDKAKKLTETEIIPWLKADKYSFAVITEENLARLKNLKNFEEYRTFLKEVFPGRGF